MTRSDEARTGLVHFSQRPKERSDFALLLGLKDDFEAVVNISLFGYRGDMRFFRLIAIFIPFLLLSQEEIAEEEKWLDLVRQHKEFQQVFFTLHEKELVRQVKEGQQPKALFIGCSDSRFVPNLILGTGPGDLFIIRAAGNFVPVYDPTIAWDGIQASIEYAIEVLGIQDIIVCGHSYCGAIRALFDKPDPKLIAIDHWIRFGTAAKEIVNQTIPEASIEVKIGRAAKISAVIQLHHLLTYPYILKKVREKKLFLHGWYYLLEEGRLLYYDPNSHRFRPFEEIEAAEKTSVP